MYNYPAVAVPAHEAVPDRPADRGAAPSCTSGAMELANAYTELNDPITQEQTFSQQLAGPPDDDSMAKMDHDFIRAHAPCGCRPRAGSESASTGLVMLLTNTQTIRDVILFPAAPPGV